MGSVVFLKDVIKLIVGYRTTIDVYQSIYSKINAVRSRMV